MRLAILCLVLIFNEAANLREVKVPADGEGHITIRGNSDVGDTRIMTLRDYQISSEVTSLKLHGGAKVLIADGRSGRMEEFSIQDGRLVRSVRESDSEPTDVTFPFRWETETRKLFIYPMNFGDDDFMKLRYISFHDDGCRINKLATASGKICDRPSLSPVAKQCNITRSCGENYIQYNKHVQCYQAEWHGDTRCMPIRSVINSRCMYRNDDERELQIDDSCPYTPDDIITFYSSVEGVDFAEPGRSGKVTINCRPPCSSGRYCQNMRSKRVYAHCLLCRIKLRCNSRVAILGR